MHQQINPAVSEHDAAVDCAVVLFPKLLDKSTDQCYDHHCYRWLTCFSICFVPVLFSLQAPAVVIRLIEQEAVIYVLIMQ